MLPKDQSNKYNGKLKPTGSKAAAKSNAHSKK